MKAESVSLVIALFDTGSDDRVPHCYAYGVPMQKIHDCGGFKEPMLKIALDTMKNDPQCEFKLWDEDSDQEDIEQIIDNIKEQLIDLLIFDCLNDLPTVIANDQRSKAEHLGDIECGPPPDMTSARDSLFASRFANTISLTWPNDEYKHTSENPMFELLLGRCDCGYHFTVDHTFVDQAGDFSFNCPACGKVIHTAEVFPE